MRKHLRRIARIGSSINSLPLRIISGTKSDKDEIAMKQIIFFLAIVAASMSPSIARQATSSPIEVSVIPEIRSGDPFLHIQLKNVSHHSQKMGVTELPWRDDSTFWVFIGVSTLSGHKATSEPIRGLGNFEIRDILLSPGETISGRIDLKKSLEGLEALCQQGDVLIFWSFDPSAVDRGVPQRVAGSVAFQNGCKSPDTRN